MRTFLGYVTVSVFACRSATLASFAVRIDMLGCLDHCASYAVRIDLAGRVGAFDATDAWEQAAYLSNACGWT